MPNYTQPLTLNLMNLEGLREGLEMLGVTWKPEVYDHGNPPLTDGLYAWATGEGAILHIGTGRHRDGLGLTRVLPAQMAAAAQPDWIHGHAMTVRRVQASGIEVRPYAGELISADLPNPSWLQGALGQLGSDFGPDDQSDILEAARKLRADPYAHVERFAVRLSMYLGDTGAPLNHTYKNAWTAGGKKPLSQALSHAAMIVAARLRGDLRE